MTLELLTAPLPRTYDAVLDPDGVRVRVQRVPVFAVTREEDGRDERDAEWLRQALSIYEARAAGGYMPPMHFKHHGSVTTTEPAGHFELREVCEGEVNPGDVRSVLLGDLVFKDRPTYERWKRDFQHRSVEISPDYPNEINSLALLDDEAPYFRFPIPKVREMFSARGRGSKQIQVWRAAMADKDEKDSPPAGTPPVAEQKHEAAPAAVEDKVLAGIMALAKQHEQIISMLQKITGMEKAEQTAAYATPSTPVVETGGHAAESEKQPPGAPAVMSAETAKFSATVLGLQEKVANLQREREVDEMFSVAKDALFAARARSGRAAPTAEELATHRKNLMTGGKPALDALLFGLNEVPKVSASSSFTAVGPAGIADSDMPASLRPLIAQGGEVAERARNVGKAFRNGEFRAQGIGEDALPRIATLKPLTPGVAQPLTRKGF